MSSFDQIQQHKATERLKSRVNAINFKQNVTVLLQQEKNLKSHKMTSSKKQGKESGLRLTSGSKSVAKKQEQKENGEATELGNGS